METKNIRYPYLPENKTILYVPEDNQYMLLAKEIALTESTDRQVSTGVVVVGEEGDILVKAANQSALKNKFFLNTHKYWCLRKLFGISSGKKYWLCPGCASSHFHAESLAVEKSIKFGINISNSDLYLWGHWWCCQPCWDRMIKANIKNVYLMEGIFDKFH